MTALTGRLAVSQGEFELPASVKADGGRVVCGAAQWHGRLARGLSPHLDAVAKGLASGGALGFGSRAEAADRNGTVWRQRRQNSRAL
jgi:hypothetical protein